MNVNEMEYIGDCGCYGHGYCRALAGCKVTDRPTVCLNRNYSGRCDYLATCPRKPTETQLEDYYKSKDSQDRGK